MADTLGIRARPPWPWHDVDGVAYCDEHGIYQCRFCEGAHIARNETRHATFMECAKYARDCASLQPDDDVGRAQLRIAEWCERRAAE